METEDKYKIEVCRRYDGFTVLFAAIREEANEKAFLAISKLALSNYNPMWFWASLYRRDKFNDCWNCANTINFCNYDQFL